MKRFAYFKHYRHVGSLIANLRARPGPSPKNLLLPFLPRFVGFIWAYTLFEAHFFPICRNPP
jgi:hypothetical protein